MTAEVIIQGGNLVLLAAVLGGLFRLAYRVIPLVDRGIRAIVAAEAAFARLDAKVDALEGRGVCPLLESRNANGGRPTEPEVAT